MSKFLLLTAVAAGAYLFLRKKEPLLPTPQVTPQSTQPVIVAVTNKGESETPEVTTSADAACVPCVNFKPNRNLYRDYSINAQVLDLKRRKHMKDAAGNYRMVDLWTETCTDCLPAFQKALDESFTNLVAAAKESPGKKADIMRVGAQRITQGSKDIFDYQVSRGLLPPQKWPVDFNQMRAGVTEMLDKAIT